MSRFARLAVAGLVLALAPLSAAAQQPAATGTLQQETTLVLRGDGRVEMKPDYAVVNVGVTFEAETAAAAMKQQAEKMTAVVGGLKAAGIADRDLRTSNLTLNPAYTYAPNQPQKLRGYVATNRVTVKVGRIDKLGLILDVLVSAGSNTINGVGFGVEDNEKAMKEARAKAVQDAMAKAEDYAKAMGYRVKRIVSVREPDTQSTDRYAGAIGGVVAFQSVEVTPIESGEVTIRQQVDVVFEMAK